MQFGNYGIINFGECLEIDLLMIMIDNGSERMLVYYVIDLAEIYLRIL
jgi:hypothetical protein